MFDIFREIHWHYLDDPKAVACLVTAVAAFVAAGFVGFDLVRNKKNQRVPKIWQPTLLMMVAIKLSVGVFASIRFFDALYDIAYVIENPTTETTLSQNVPILEVPMLGIGITLIIFILHYSWAYTRLPRIPPTD